MFASTTRVGLIQALAPMEVILHATNAQELRTALSQLDIEVPGRAEGRTSQHTERYCIAHLVATLPESRLFFPLTITHGDKPDFVVRMQGIEVGVEHTEAVPENVARAQFLRGKGLGPEVYFIPHATPGEPRKTAEELRQAIEQDEPGDGWVGDSAEQEWAAAMIHHVKQKLVKATTEGFTRHSGNWLLVYDNWPLPHIDIAKAASILYDLAREIGAFAVFDTVFVLAGSNMCEMREAILVSKLVDPRAGANNSFKPNPLRGSA